MDRIDLHIEVAALRYKGLQSTQPVESSATIRNRVIQARKIQRKRFAQESIYSNALMKPRHIKKFCPLEREGQKLLERAIESLGLSARAYHRILKVARTIADIASLHLLEAVQYRSLDRRLF